MEQLKEGVAQMEVDDSQEWQQWQLQEDHRVEASETVGEEKGEAAGGGIMEALKRKIGELRKRIGGRVG